MTERAESMRASNRDSIRVNSLVVLSGIITLAALYFTSLYSYLLFHSVVEVFSIVIAFGTFMIAWNARQFIANNYLLFIGISYLFVGGLDLVHTLAYKGMGVFTGYTSNLATQLWIAARSTGSLSLLIAPMLLGRALNPYLVFAGYSTVVSVLLWSVFSGHFPDCFVEGVGLTPFKKVSEYVISLVLVASALFLLSKKKEFDGHVLRLLVLSILATIVSELAFTFYVSVYGFSNFAGHVLKAVAFYLIYRAVIRTGLVKPYDLLFRGIRQSEAALQESKDELERLVGERTAELRKSNDLLKREIAERGRAEEAIFKLAAIVESSDDAIIGETVEGIIVSWNRGAERIYGYSSADVIGKSVSILASPDRPDEVQEILGRIREGESVEHFETIRVRKDGRQIHVSLTASPIRDASGKVIGTSTIARDVTERKKIEAKLQAASLYARSLIEASLDPLVTISADGKIMDVNKATERVTGYSRGELIGSDFTGYCTDPDRARAGYKHVFREGFVQDYALEICRRDGHVTPVLYNASLYRDENGEVRGVFAAARDISELKKAEGILRESAIQWQTTFDAISDGVCLLDGEHRVVRSNAAMMNLLGKTEESIRGQKCYEVVHGTSAPIADCPLMRAFETHEREELAMSVDGKWFNVAVDPLIGEGGKMTGAVHIMTDITHRKAAEETLRLMNAYNRSLIEASLDPLVTIGPDGRITDVNAATENVTGLERSTLIGTDFSDYFTMPGVARAGYEQVFREGFVKDYALEIKHRDGHTTPVLYNASLYTDESGKVRGVFAAARDVTQRKRAEEALRLLGAYNRSLIETSLDPLVTIGSDGRITDVNAATETITGDPREEIIGADFSDYFSDREKARAGYQQVFRDGFVYDYPLEIRHRDGRTTPVLYNASVYRNEKGDVMGIFAAARDITALKKAEMELRRLNEELEGRVAVRTAELEASNKELEAFTYSVSHDLRAPLRAIDGFSNVLLEDYAGKLDDEGKRFLDIIRGNTKKMAQLIDDLLNLSRLGRREIEMSEIDMEQLARSAYDEVMAVVPVRAIELDIKTLPPARGDRSMLRQVLVNLLSNAVKFTGPVSHARIEVGGRAEGTEKIYHVKDNGVGFDMNYANKLFGVFQRLHGTDEFEGTGVGLAIVQRIIHRHGGRVWAEGKVKEGAAFYFALPK